MTKVRLVCASCAQSGLPDPVSASARWSARLSARSWPVTKMAPALQSRCVSGMPIEAGAARPLLMPLTTSTWTPAARRWAHSSPPRPKMNGSPPFRRTTQCPASASDIIRRSMNSCEVERQPPRLPTCTMRAVAGACAKISGLTRSSTSTTSAEAITRTAFNVNNSGSPGPAPTKKTLPGCLFGLPGLCMVTPACL